MSSGPGLDPIEAYLSQQSDAGRRDSEGSFTISAEKALDKLATHQLPRSSAWILKMVQAGVTAGASGLWVSQGARSCKLRFKGGDFGSLEEIREAWIESLPIKRQVHRHLSIALRATAFARRRPVLVVQHCPRMGLRSLQWNGASMCRIASAEETVKGVVTKGETLFFFSQSPLGQDETTRKLHGVSGVTAAEYKELTTFAVCCSMPLWADNRPLNHFGMEDVSMIRKSLAFSAQGVREGDSSICLPPSVQESTGLQEAGLAWTLYHSTRREASRISWVKDGVVCEEETLHTHPDEYQLRLFVPANDIETDLTALQLRFPSRDLRARRTAGAALRFCEEMRTNRSIGVEIAELRQKKASNWATATAIIIGGVLFGPVTSGFSFLASAGAVIGLAVKNAAKEQQTPPDLQRFLMQLERRYEGHG